MSDEVGTASKAIDDHGNALETMGGKADSAERNIIGVHDVIDGTATIMQGPGKQGIVSYLQGWADLAGGLAPLLESLSATKLAVLGNTAAMAAQAVWSGIVKAATVVWTGVQWALNAALAANPIVLITLAIIALVAIIVLIATKTTWFQDIWNAAWGGIKAAAKAVADWFSGPFVGFFVGAFNKVKGWIDSAVGWFKDIPGRAKSALSAITDAISKPFKAGLNIVSDAWNNTIGKLHWSFPSIFGVGGFTISAPKLPHFHSGGVVPGPVGQATLAVLQGGERVTAAGPSASSGGGAAVTFTGNTDSAVATLIMRLVRDGLIQIAPA